jgi:hypothetical protein
MKTRTMIMGTVLSLVMGGTAAAADKHDGKWHSVEAKSSWSNGQFPKGFSLTIELTFKDNQLQYRSLNDTDKTKTAGTGFTATLDGKPTPLPGKERFTHVSVRKLGPNEFEVLKTKDGDVIVGEYWTFYPDGKTLVRRGVGKSPEGRSKAYEEYFVRQ